MATKRDVLKGVGLAAGVGAAAPAAAARGGDLDIPDLSILSRAALIDRDRATSVMAAAGLDALLLTRSANVYWATNVWPASDRMGAIGSCAALVPRARGAPIILIAPEFSFYYIASDMGLAPGVVPLLVQPGGRSAMFRLADGAQPTPREARRRALTADARTAPDRAGALRAGLALAGLKAGVIGTDERAADDRLAEIDAGFATRPCEDVVRRARMVQTPAGVALMRAASAANVAAAMATVAAARELGSLRAVRQRFFAEAAARGARGVFMVVDGVYAEAFDAPLGDGAAFMIDCVSEVAGHHGDFARTVFIGEPARSMKSVPQTVANAWGEVRSALKPGLRFSQIQEIGRKALVAQGADLAIPFGPHLVGLHHSDQPALGLDGRREDLALEAGMILSVDCPLMDAGLGGTAHLEDLTLITATGSEPIHAAPPPVMVV
jgi:Xaa-Pro aminopeptidase